MDYTEKVCFSLYKGEAPIPVNIFKQKTWVLLGGTELQVSIIGKSHRIISRIGNRCFTEFIAYMSGKELHKPLDHFRLKAGEAYQKTYQEGDWLYRIWINMIPRLFIDIRDFTNSLKPSRKNWETLDHGFAMLQRGAGIGPFTGVAVDPEGNAFNTVHTYPEHQQSIISRTEIICSPLAS